MKSRISYIFHGLILLLFTATVTQADLTPSYSIQRMCFEADLIVAGKHVGDGEVEVEHIFHATVPNNQVLKKIEVPSIPDCSKVVDRAFRRDEPNGPIRTDRVVLFLKDVGRGKFEPFNMYPPGARGLFWLEDEKCYGFRQYFIPGPFVLSVSTPDPSPEGIPRDPEMMWERIEIGLAQRARWESIKATEDPAERARLMAEYLAPDTKPEGYVTGTLNFRTEISAIGPEAFPAMAEVLERTMATGVSDTTLLVLCDIGYNRPGTLGPAVPILCDLLADPGPTSPYYILCALTAAADAGAIPHVRPMLEHENGQVRTQAAEALAAMDDQESFDAIAALIEALPELNEKTRQIANSKVDLCSALFKLDPDRARPVITQLESRWGYEGVHHFIEGYR